MATRRTTYREEDSKANKVEVKGGIVLAEVGRGRVKKMLFWGNGSMTGPRISAAWS